MALNFEHIPELTYEEIKQKYIRTTGISFANPPDYNSSRSNHKSYINIDYDLEDFYNSL